MLKKRTAKHTQGVFIAIEGTDGSGKATQFKLLKDRLASEGYDVASYDFPQYDKPSSHFVQKYLNGEYGTIDEVGPYTSSLFFALDRYEVAKEIRQALEQGKIVIANRFTGSSMAHQGTKFTHAEERRGFFIWLDNLEFTLLNIPRPDMNFVLRVPAETAQKLVDKKETRSYTDKKRDLHEADLEHLRKSVEVYDDLCRLFPKDFSPLDCVRNGELMDIENIQSLLWEKVRTLLPQPISTKKISLHQEAIANNNKETHTDGSLPLPLAHHITLENTSCLLATKIESEQPLIYHGQPLASIGLEIKSGQGKYPYHTPDSLNPEMRLVYETTMDSLFELYSEMVHRLAEHIQKHSSTQAAKKANGSFDAALHQARGILQPALPTATQLNVDITAAQPALESIAASLLSDNLPESRHIGERIYTEIGEPIPRHREDDIAAPKRKISGTTLQNLAEQLLPSNYASDITNPVTLTDVWPRNELDIVADLLYEHSNLTFQEIRNEVASWPYTQKQEVIKAYMEDSFQGQPQCSRALEKVHYSFDVLCDYNTLRNLGSYFHTAEGFVWQQPTPRYGYDVPQPLEDAGLTDLFERCFDISLELHSKLQAAGYIAEAQYAILLGHKMRWKIICNAREAFCIKKAQNPGCTAIIQQLHHAIATVHPLIAQGMKFVNKSEDPELARGAIARYT